MVIDAQRADRTPAARVALTLAVVTAVAGLLCVVLRWDAPYDGTEVDAGWARWRGDAVVIGTPGTSAPSASGTDLVGFDAVLGVEGIRFADGIGRLDRRAVRGDTLDYQIRRDTAVTSVAVRMGRPNLRALLVSASGLLVWLAAMGALAAWLRIRRPSATVVVPLLVSAAGLGSATLATLAQLTALDVALGGALFWLYHVALVGGAAVGWGGMLALARVALSAGGRFGGPVASAVCYLGPVLAVSLWGGLVGVIGDGTPAAVGAVHAGHFVVALVSLLAAGAMGTAGFVQLRRHARQPWLTWLAVGAAVSAGTGIATWLLPEIVYGGHRVPARYSALAGLPWVVATTAAVLRYGLLSIERIVSRSLAYAGLVCALLLTYVAANLVVTWTLSPSSNMRATMVTVAVAVIALTVHNVLSRWASRLVYGSRGDPDAALSVMSGQLSRSVTPDQVLSTIAQTIAHTIRLPYVAVELTSPDGQPTSTYTHGRPVGPLHDMPLTAGPGNNRHLVGRLRVSARDPDDPLPRADRMVLQRHADQIAMALRAVHADLAIQQAHAAERWELGQRLHNLVKYQITAIAHLAEGARATIQRLPGTETTDAVHHLLDIDRCAKDALADIDSIVEDMRPPALDRLGLVRALRTHATSPRFADLHVTVESEGVPMPLPAAVEIAAYQITLEAMNNARQHAHPTRITVAVAARSGVLDLQVLDDGTGGGDNAGIGLDSISAQAERVGGICVRARAAEGGTIVHAVLPIPGADNDNS